MPKEQYMCQLCANHGIFNQPKKGHKQKCPHRLCPCPLCALNTKRRRLDQMERQLRNVGSEDESGGFSSSPTTITVIPNPSNNNFVSSIPQNNNNNFMFQNGNGNIFPSYFKQEKKDEIIVALNTTVGGGKMKNTERYSRIGRHGNRCHSSLSSSYPPYCIPIPATMNQTEMRSLKRPAPISPEIQAQRRRRAELFEQTLARITAKKSNSSSSSPSTSIFHSVQMLAEPG